MDLEIFTLQLNTLFTKHASEVDVTDDLGFSSERFEVYERGVRNKLNVHCLYMYAASTPTNRYTYVGVPLWVCACINECVPWRLMCVRGECMACVGIYV